MRTMARRLKRLEARAGDDDPAEWSIERLLPELASCLCGVPVSRLREVIAEAERGAATPPLSDHERLGLAISRGEGEAYYATLGTGGEVLRQGARAIEDVFARVYEEWRRTQEARSAEGAETDRKVAWLARPAQVADKI